MKRFFIISLFIFITTKCAYADIQYKIDNETQKCLETNYKNDFQMAQCNYSAIKNYNNEINVLLQSLKKELTKSQYYKLKKSQNKWIKYIKRDNAMLENTLELKLYYEPYLVSSSIKLQNYKQRYQELADLYKYVIMYK